MKKNLILLVLLLCCGLLHAQCLTNSLVINTGYNPITGTAITPGINGGTPVPDPHWTVTFETPSIATAILFTGLIEVVPGANADIITTLSGWTSPPPGNPAGWISCINSNTYSSDGTGPSGTAYSQTLTRSFRLCSDDSVVIDFYVANDNYIAATDIDGVPLLFAQPALPTVSNFTTFSHFTQTVFLTAGTHFFNVYQSNYNTPSPSPNPTGMVLYGTVSSATALNTLVSESFLSCSSFICSSTCNAITLADSLHPCAGDIVTLPATIVGSDSVLEIIWSPATGLSSTTVSSPTLTVGTVSSYYYISVRSLIPFNLVSNGDFGSGNVGFTSSYTYAAPPSTVLLEGNYSVYTDPHGVHTGFSTFGDHTTGTGNMMIINGASTPTDIWCETIPVLPNTDYDFSAWIANCSSVTVPPDVPILQFRINGVLIGTPTTISSAPGVWTNFFNTWNSGTNTTATICIYDLNTTPAGNDFAIDDITFKEICVAKDSIYIAVKAPDTTATRTDTTLCIAAAPLTLHGTAGYASYLWSTGATTVNTPVSATGVYWVYNNNLCTTRIDSFYVNFIPLPALNLGNDTAFCIGNTLVLSSAQPVGTSYLWSTGSTADSIMVTTSGNYWLQLNNGCIVADSINILVSPFPVVDLGPDVSNCLGAPVTLQSLVSYTAPSYLWSDASTTPAITTSVTGRYWLTVTEAGCAGADTIHVTVLFDTFTLSNHDTAICLGKWDQIRLTADPDATFQWLPTAGIPYATISSPLITPDTSALYKVHIYLAGCPEIVDSVFIDVQPNPLVYMGGNRSVCANDTLHLHASVSPQWYTHYIYHWSPGSHLDDSTAQSVVFIPGDSAKIAVFVSTPAGCASTDSAMLVVHAVNFATLDTDYTLCRGDSVQFIPQGGMAYAWHPGRYLSDSIAATPWVHAITSQHYIVVARNQFNCLDTLGVRVTVLPAAVIHIEDAATLYPGESFQVHTQSNCSSFAWFPPTGLDNPFSSDPVMTPEVSTKYIVTGTTEQGCQATDSIDVYIDISSVLALPNAFTPGSSVNSKLYLLKRGVAQLKHFSIFNRWGNKVFETTNINEGWDGSYNGVPQAYGVYIYDIEATANDGKTIKKHGNVTLLR